MKPVEGGAVDVQDHATARPLSDRHVRGGTIEGEAAASVNVYDGRLDLSDCSGKPPQLANVP